MLLGPGGTFSYMTFVLRVLQGHFSIWFYDFCLLMFGLTFNSMKCPITCDRQVDCRFPMFAYFHSLQSHTGKADVPDMIYLTLGKRTWLTLFCCPHGIFLGGHWQQEGIKEKLGKTIYRYMVLSCPAILGLHWLLILGKMSPLWDVQSPSDLRPFLLFMCIIWERTIPIW